MSDKQIRNRFIIIWVIVIGGLLLINFFVNAETPNYEEHPVVNTIKEVPLGT